VTATLGDLIDTHLARLRTKLGKKELVTIETGSIRSPEIRFRDGDGWSTVALASNAKVHGGKAISVDLDTSVAAHVLAAHGLTDNADLITGHSIDVFGELLVGGRAFDFILLDSENDAQLILHEWFLAKRLVRPGGIIMIDDVEPGSKEVLKGNDLIPHLKAHNISYKMHQRSKNRITTGVAVVEF
jgi:predicted O-methyltransferase YrrM